jgi:hypothetical protein
MEDKELETLFGQLWDIPQHLDNPPLRVAPYISPPRPRVRYSPPPPPLPPERPALCYLGVEEVEIVDLESEEVIMADRGRGGRNRGRGSGGGRGDNWNRQFNNNQFQQGTQQQQQPFQQNQGPYPQFPPQPYGFAPGGMPPPWAFQGPYPQFNPQQYGFQSNQWIAPSNEEIPQNSQAQVDDSVAKAKGGMAKQMQKKKPGGGSEVQVIPNQMSYVDTICLGCGEPGHFKQSCDKKAFCFICKATNHGVEGCPVVKRPPQVAKYIGSAANGLGFFHIEIPEVVVNPVTTTKNCGLVLIEEGNITKAELAKEFAGIYRTNWPWQIRELTQWSYLVKFPPHLPVDQVIGYPRFGLTKPGVWVKVEAWDDDPDPVAVMQVTWMKIHGLQPPWCEWNVIAQAVSVCGILEEIDWMSVFKDCAEVVRVKIKCRDATRIPAGRLFHFQGKFHQLLFEVEGEPAIGVAEDPPIPPPPPPSDENDEQGNEEQNGEKQDGMDTDRGSVAGNASASSGVVNPGPASSGSVGRRLVTDGGEVKEYVSGEEVYELLLKNGEVDEEGRFIWRSGPSRISEEVSEEIQNFLLEDQESLACKHGVNLDSMERNDGDMELALPEDILPSFEKTDTEGVMDTDQLKKPRKKKAWGPVQATRQSSRVDRSMNVMKKAIEYKKKNNLEEPNKKMKGIMHSNAFQSLDVDYLESLARNVGIDISAVSGSSGKDENHGILLKSQVCDMATSMSVAVEVEIPRECNTHGSPVVSGKKVGWSTPVTHSKHDIDEYEDEGEKWIEVIRKSRGKHPRKRIQC